MEKSELGVASTRLIQTVSEPPLRPTPGGTMGEKSRPITDASPGDHSGL
jgi:hypothetical protein